MYKINFDHFYRYDEMVDFLTHVSNEKKDFCKLISLAKTLEGRDVYLLEITDYSTGITEEKGAYYVQGNIHGMEAAGTMATLHLIQTLLYCEEYKELLKKVAFYIVPRVNPDGAECALATHAPIRSRFEITEKRNGLIPKDINGDGYILNMRIKDPAGPFVEDEIDKRIMVKRKPGDKGPFYRMYVEGIINDYDGGEIVSGYKNIDFNRNYPAGWVYRADVGTHPFSEIETKAIGDFLISHPNVFAAIDLHCGPPAILRPNLSKQGNDANQEDLNLILTIGKIAEEITGFPLIKSGEYNRQSWRKPNLTPGIANDWYYHYLGISGYLIEVGWGFSSAGISEAETSRVDSKTREIEFTREVLKFHDSKNSKIFVPWEECDHPQLGKVEVGGLFGLGNARYMYPPDMEEISPKLTEFFIEHAKYHPELFISNVKSEAVGNNIYRIRAEISNIGGFSTNIMDGGGGYIKRIPVKVSLFSDNSDNSDNNVKVLSRITNHEIENLNALAGPYGPGIGVRVHGSCHLEWFVRGNAGETITIEAFHPKAGKARVEHTL
jgi:hypothetical protein